jgi:hypothetical protein
MRGIRGCGIPTALLQDKRPAPAPGQAIDMAWLSAGRRSVGSAIRRQKARFLKALFGTSHTEIPDTPVSRDDNEFEILMGRIGNRGHRESSRFCAPGGKRVSNQVRRQQGRRGGCLGGCLSFGRGRPALPAAGCSPPDRRVVVKARVVRHQGRAFRSAPLSAHVAYLERDGVTRDGDKGRHVRRCRRSRQRRGLRATRPGRPASFPLRRHAGGCHRDDRLRGPYAPDAVRIVESTARRRACGSPSPGLSGRRSMKPLSSAAMRIATSRRVQRSAPTSHTRAERISMLGPGAELGRDQVLGPRA